MAVLIRRLAGAVVLLALSVHAQAAFEARWSRFGDNTVIHDTSTGLEWLRLDQTRGISYDSVYAQLDTTFEGFAFADSGQMNGLVRGVGIPYWNYGAGPPPSQSLLDASHSFLTLFGALGDGTTSLSLSGFPYWGDPSGYDPGVPFHGDLYLQAWTLWWTPTRTNYVDDHAPFAKPESYPRIGSFLVSTAPVPEPSTYALMLAGLGFLGFHIRACAARGRVLAFSSTIAC